MIFVYAQLFWVFSLDVVTGQHRDGDNDLILSDNSTVTSGNISEYLISRILNFIKEVKHDMIGDHDLFQQSYNFMFYAYALRLEWNFVEHQRCPVIYFVSEMFCSW